MDPKQFFELAQDTLGFIGGGAETVDKVLKLFRSQAQGHSVAPAEVADLLDKARDDLIAAKQAQLGLLQALIELKLAMVQSDREAEIRQRYTLAALANGARVLALRPEYEGEEPDHYLCPDCGAKGNRSYLQPQGNALRCNPCDLLFLRARGGRDGLINDDAAIY